MKHDLLGSSRDQVKKVKFNSELEELIPNSKVDEDEDNNTFVEQDLFAPKKSNKSVIVELSEEDEDSDVVDEIETKQDEGKKKENVLEDEDDSMLIDSSSETYEELREDKIIPFNMEQEKQEGDFDEEGNYTLHRDTQVHYDNWLIGVTKADIVKAKALKESQILRHVQQSPMEIPFSIKDTLKRLLPLLEPRETILKVNQFFLPAN